MSSRGGSVLCSHVGPTGLVRVGPEQLLDEVDLDEAGSDDDDALCHGPEGLKEEIKNGSHKQEKRR